MLLHLSVCFEVRPHRAGDGIPERDASHVGMVRRGTARLRYCGLERLVHDTTLIVSELVTNAVQHGSGTRVTFTMTVQDGFLNLAVHDETPSAIPKPERPGADAESGRGLFLVDLLVRELGGGSRTTAPAPGALSPWPRRFGDRHRAALEPPRTGVDAAAAA
ncbi:ATP-binding protein [Streptomyces sp. NPDC014864]|uniref:ATP-binding protein n=1 Tax=Streptomyces sp. NPDC014864 TaxID=3364924 RepID=UPI0036FFE803